MSLLKPKRDRKEDIFEAALECFNESGYYRTTIDSIAEKAKISKGGVYYHFKSKDNLFIELFNYRCKKYFDQVETYVKEIEDPQERINLFVTQASTIVGSNKDFMRFFLEFMSIGAREPKIRKVMTEYYENSIDNFTRIISDGIAAGKFSEADPKEIAQAVYFLSMGVFFTYFTINPDFDLIGQHVLHIKNILQALEKTNLPQ